MSRIEFSEDFHWGVASAAACHEGAIHADGRGESIWDRFALRPDAVRDGRPSDRVRDSYPRFEEELALLRELGCTSYRFSFAWPRIQPQGKGSANRLALDHYSRWIDALLDADIRPLPTLYHWDLPQALEDAGGWPMRDTAGRFADYAEIVARGFGDRVEQFVLFDEAATFTREGYWTGNHAPGRRDFDAFLRAGHSVNLAQAAAFHAMKAVRSALKLGSAHRYAACEAAGDHERDRVAAERWHALCHDWHLLPAFAGRYPDAFEGGLPAERMGLRYDDLERIRVPLDWLGVNPGPRQLVEHSADDSLGLRLRTDSNAAPTPESLCHSLLRLTRDYTRDEVKPIIEITSSRWLERADRDVPGADGEVHDEPRMRFHRQSLIALARASRHGVDLRGYHAWSLVDGFEWESGNEGRTGLAWVDAESGTRRLKQSGRWFGRAAAENGFAPEDDE